MMIEKQLKKIEEKYDMWADDYNLFPQDIELLIKQAKQVSALETTVDFYHSALRDADRRVQELEGERDEWRDTSQSYYMTNQELRGQNKRYREALKLIMRRTNYELYPDLIQIYTIAWKAIKGEE